MNDFIEKYHYELMKGIENHLIDKGFDGGDIEEIMCLTMDLVKKGENNLVEFIKNYKYDAIKYTYESLDFLPCELICELADYLIQLTALKQKLSENIETVSSETDVAFLTKNFNWFKKNGEIIKYSKVKQ